MNTKRRKILLNSIKAQLIKKRKKNKNNTTRDTLSGLGIVSKRNSVKSLAGIKPQKTLRSILNIF